MITAAIADAIEQARKELPPEDRRRAEEVEAVTYSSERGMAQEVEERRPRRRPRRKRRPRPEVIANLRTGAEDEEGGEA